MGGDRDDDGGISLSALPHLLVTRRLGLVRTESQNLTSWRGFAMLHPDVLEPGRSTPRSTSLVINGTKMNPLVHPHTHTSRGGFLSSASVIRGHVRSASPLIGHPNQRSPRSHVITAPSTTSTSFLSKKTMASSPPSHPRPCH